MRRPKILVAGSFVLDQIAVTKTVPGEGETVLGTTFRKAPGGKGLNQAAQAAKLGAEVTMVLQALSVVLQSQEHVTPQQYVRWHPGGKLGELREEEKGTKVC